MRHKARTVGIIGSGGQAREIVDYLDNKSIIAFFAVDKKYLRNTDKSIDISNPTDTQRETSVSAGVGAPGLRKELVKKWSGLNYFQFISDQSYVSSDIKIGIGSIVAPSCVVTTGVSIGMHTIVNIGSTVSHDCSIGDYVTISPGSHIAGSVVIGDGVFIGIGAVISNGIKVARGSVIGAGAVVVKDITTENSVVVGVPAKEIKLNPSWMYEI